MSHALYEWWHVQPVDEPDRAWRGRAASPERALQEAHDVLGVGGKHLTDRLPDDYDGPSGELRHDGANPQCPWVAVHRCRDCGMPIEDGERTTSPNATREARRHDAAWELPKGCQRAVVRRLERVDRRLEDLTAKVERMERRLDVQDRPVGAS